MADQFPAAGIAHHEVARLNGHFACGALPALVVARDPAADHLVDHRVARWFRRCERAADPAVAHDDDAVGNLEHFGQPMRDEDDGDAARAERAHPVEQPLRFAIGQCRRRLVEDQQAGILATAPARSAPVAGSRGRGRRVGSVGSMSRPKSASAALARARRSGRSIKPIPLRLVVEEQPFRDGQIAARH